MSEARLPALANATPEAAEMVLADLSLVPVPGFDWLARAVQDALLPTLPPEPIGCEQVSGIEPVEPTRTQRRDHAQLVKADLESALVAVIKHHELIGSDFAIEAERKFAAAIAAITPKAEMRPSRPRESDTRTQRRNIQRAEALAPIFELAFSLPASLNDWPDAKLGVWPEFYSRIVALAFGETEVRNLRDVLKKARRRQLQFEKRFGRMQFGPDFVPEYPL